MRREEQEKGVEEWGGIRCKAVDAEGDFMKAKVKRLVVKPESGDVALEWGKNAPRMEQDDNDESDGSDGSNGSNGSNDSEEGDGA
jgi:hypothetical protein